MDATAFLSFFVGLGLLFFIAGIFSRRKNVWITGLIVALVSFVVLWNNSFASPQ